MANLQKSNFEIIPYDKKYFSKIIDLFKNSCNKNKTKSFFDYSLSKTPYGNPITFLVKYKQMIIGLHSIRPLMLRVKNESFLGGLTFNTMTHSKHGHKGIFTLLAKETHKEAKKQKYQFVLGFANSNSIHGYKKYLNHVELSPLNFIKIIDSNYKNSEAKIHNHWFPNTLGNLNENFFPVKIEKDYNFIKWRYEKSPQFKYLTCFKQNEYFFIFKEFQNQIQIIDFFVNDPKYYKIILSTVTNFAKKRSKDVTMWISNKHPLLTFVNEFTNIPPLQFFHIISFNKNLDSEILNFDNWHYVMGDSDIF